MKRISGWLASLLVCSVTILPAQDPAVEERLGKLGGQIEDLLSAVAKQDKRLSALEREVDLLREQLNKPSGNYAGAEDLRKLAEKLQEVDRKRIEDNERIVSALERLEKAPVTRAKPPREKPQEEAPRPPAGGNNEPGYEHVIAPGDTLSTIAQAYREKGVKVTVEQILKANPGLKERSLRVGQKIKIPGQ